MPIFKTYNILQNHIDAAFWNSGQQENKQQRIPNINNRLEKQHRDLKKIGLFDLTALPLVNTQSENVKK